ncbi:DUF3953 domain-containing protein [Bacillus sp. MRMR6]|uniref:DUF3953 domain-containing protein n=1 Tax=Bacillus sp. MRMR6 TaxID=1928617 RepID=UPI000950E42F|nr:DUF3953 domain-containing protein [Bacillus sp. MRMR6]OLS38518.1 hypothetical protein BTR25_13935 [Bacillus sp. MRMR6]
MYKKMRIILGIIVLVLAGYGLITKNFIAQPFMMLTLSAFIVVGGINEFKQGRKGRAFVSIAFALFVLIILVQILVSK